MGNTVSKRHTGIELFRIVSMILVCVLHVLGKGGILTSTTEGSVKNISAWSMESLAFCAVNCFALISGYVGCKSRFRWSRLLSVWLQTLFCCVVIAAVFVVFFDVPLNFATLKMNILPVTSGTYWYISSYVGMALFAPFMNLVIEKVEKRKLEILFVVLLVLFSFLPCVTFTTYYGLEYGYSMVWLSIIYLVGGYMKKYDITSRVSKKLALAMFFAAGLLPVVAKVMMQKLALLLIDRTVGGGIFIEYTSPFIVLSAVALLCFFANLDIQNSVAKRIIHFISPAALGVYIIHVHPYVFGKIDDAFTFMADYNFVVLIFAVMGAALGIYIVCTVLELARIGLFKLCGVNKLLAWVDRKTENYTL